MRKSNYDEHLLSQKHKKSMVSNEKPAICFACQNCNKKYKDNSGLWRHKKKCINDIPKQDNTLLNYLMKENMELKQMIKYAYEKTSYNL